MRAVLQRVTDADVSVDSKITGKIGKGFVILLGVEDGDSEADADYLVEKISAKQDIDILCGFTCLLYRDAHGILIHLAFTQLK